MISAKPFAKTIEKFVSDNAPTLLTAVGVVGTVTTAVLTGKATLKAAELIDAEETERWQMLPDVNPDYPKLTTKESVKLVWMEYLPAAGVGVATVSAIIFANRISTGRAAALAAAYSLSERRFGEYRDKVVQKFNPNKEEQVRTEIAQDKVSANPPKDGNIIITGAGDVICYDTETGRYFRSNIEQIRKVENQINKRVNQEGQATLQDFYVALGLPPTPWSEELGWNTDKLLDVQFNAVLDDREQPVISFTYACSSIRGENPPF